MKKLSRSYVRHVATGIKFAMTEPHSDGTARVSVTLWSINVLLAVFVIGMNILMWSPTSAFWLGLFAVWGSLEVVFLSWALQGFAYRRRLADERAAFYALVGTLNGNDGR